MSSSLLLHWVSLDTSIFFSFDDLLSRGYERLDQFSCNQRTVHESKLVQQRWKLNRGLAYIDNTILRQGVFHQHRYLFDGRVGILCETYQSRPWTRRKPERWRLELWQVDFLELRWLLSILRNDRSCFRYLFARFCVRVLPKTLHSSRIVVFVLLSWMLL